VKFQAKSKITENMASRNGLDELIMPVSFASKRESDSQLSKQASPLIKTAYGEDTGQPLMIKKRSESQTPVLSIDDY